MSLAIVGVLEAMKGCTGSGVLVGERRGREGCEGQGELYFLLFEEVLVLVGFGVEDE